MDSKSQEKFERIERIRQMVNEDFDRITNSNDPWEILNLQPGAAWEIATAKYERYERFYRAENFQKLGDMDLTRKAMDIRRSAGQAILVIESQNEENNKVTLDPVSILEIDINAYALGDIYFRDGLTYLRLGDFDASMNCFKRACDHDPTRGIARGYLTYTHFRQHMHDPRVVEDSRKNMAQAVRLSPDDADVFVLVSRFHLKLKEISLARNAINEVARINPEHPKLVKLKSRLAKVEN